ncbi:hypothetical protein J7E62_29695 [Variovorax paradoxus]|nr:hypothetical protein [Variovorax paradoxus]
MKPRERTIHFYDLVLRSSANAAGIKNAGCAELSDILKRMTTFRPQGQSLRRKASELVDLADWRYDDQNGHLVILINRADKNISDITFRNFDDGTTRKAGKTDREGLDNSCHVLVRPDPDGRTALLMMTMGSGVGTGLLERMFSLLTTSLKSDPRNDDLFNFRHPSNEVDKQGKPKTYRVRYRFACVAHKGAILDDALRHGEFQQMRLIAHKFEKFDSGGSMHIEQQSVVVKPSPNKVTSAAAIKNAIRAFTKRRNDVDFVDARISYKAANGHTKIASLDTRNLDAAFTRREIAELPIDVENHQKKISRIILSAMVKYIN